MHSLYERGGIYCSVGPTLYQGNLFFGYLVPILSEGCALSCFLNNLTSMFAYIWKSKTHTVKMHIGLNLWLNSIILLLWFFFFLSCFFSSVSHNIFVKNLFRSRSSLFFIFTGGWYISFTAFRFLYWNYLRYNLSNLINIFITFTISK